MSNHSVPGLAGLLICGILAMSRADQAVAQEALDDPSELSSTPDAVSSTFLGRGTSITMGLGASIAPAYEGSKNFKANPLPYLDIKGLFDNRVFLSTTRGLGANLLDLGPFKAGLSVSYGGGRSSSDSSRLKGLSNVNGGPVLSGFMTYELKPVSFELKAGNTFGPNPGTEVSFGTNYAFTPLPRLHVSVGPQITWADSRYDKAYFGVTSAEAARATALGNPMRAYSPGAGIKDIGLSATGMYQVTEHWGLVTHVGLSELVGDAAKNSPLTQRTFQPSFAIGGTYKF
ncbi:MAG TPA: MipA/OmpV family protein [Stellaceae bacterium]|nr:MipA/OmpV family protein [Stellaceae bacterium]